MSTIQRNASDHLIIGHGDYHEVESYPQFRLERDITIHLIAVPGARVRVRLGQALVDRIKCQLHLKKSDTNEIVDRNYAIKSYRKNDLMPNYLLTYAKEIDIMGESTVHTPRNGEEAVRLQQLIAELPQNAKVVYVACCAAMAEDRKQQLYAVDYS